MTLGPKPYYWPSMAYGGSPPIATRTGWLSLAMLPFLITFATKWNIITLLTGVSHERLQVYHRWVAWVMYVLALIHTFPFIILNIKNGTMVAAWKTRVWYWSGVAALVPQTWLVFMSWGPIRNRFYEIFKWLHYLAAAFFIPLLFIHCNFRLTSWDYFFATAALYVFSFLVRWIRTLFYNRIASANLELLPGDMVKVSISTRVKWKPGQHFFIRFFGTGIHALSAHPFTVATLPNTSDSQQNVADVYIRVRKGFTGRLGSMAKRGKLTEIGVMLDGPYGGVQGSLTSYDRVLLLGGGAGITFIVPLLLDVVRRYDEAPCKQVDVVWATRSQGRPNLPQIIQNAAMHGGTLGIAACGPESFSFDVRNAASDVQLKIAQQQVPVRELWLHTETFGW
ncbi:hypothetical protein FRC03_007276 [Tulasnella sp. 419]|nr:hypothetical protein FRC03_007276 [Tulasnella sp. 419]